MQKYEVWILCGVFLGAFLVYTYTDKFIKRLPLKTVKKLNSICFTIAIVAGVAWYLYRHVVAMAITLVALAFFFVFYDYKRVDDENKEKPAP